MNSNKNIEHLISKLLTELGENPKREGLLRTPLRVSKSWSFLTQGYQIDLDKIVNNAIFNESYDDLILVQDIEYYSLCEHHLLPFFGKAHVAYIPDGKIIGLSKIPRIVEMFSRRLQVQERMTQEISNTLDHVLAPKGVGVVIEGQHMCMQMRGVEKQNSFTTTSSMLVIFREDPKTRDEFLKIISKNR